MGTTAILLITVVLFLWGVLSGRLERADLTAPIIFVAVAACSPPRASSMRRRWRRR